MRTLRPWIIVSWIALPAVMVGGSLLLRRLSAGDPTPFQMTWLRAFHAHGGVLFMMSLLYYMFLDQTHLSASAKRIGCVAVFGGIGMLTGGFLLHAILGESGTYSIGTFVSLAGAGLLASAIMLLVYGLMTMPSSHSRTVSGGSSTL
jgi:drug/metabolite transporter superfamily protein YnfA